MLPIQEGDTPWSTGTGIPTSTDRAAGIGRFGMAITPIIATTGTSIPPAKRA